MNSGLRDRWSWTVLLMVWVGLVAGLPARAHEAYEFRGFASATNFLPKPGQTGSPKLTEPAQCFLALFTLWKSMHDPRYLLVLDHTTYSNHTEIGFDGTYCYQLGLGPIEDPQPGEEKLKHPVVQVGPLRHGVPYGAQGLARFLLLALAADRLLDESGQRNLSVPWSELETVMPVVGCLQPEPEFFEDRVGLPRSIHWRFSEPLWHHKNQRLPRHKRSTLPNSLTNQMLLAWYSVHDSTVFDDMTVPLEFTATRLAQDGTYVRVYYHGVVTNLTRVTVHSFVPDITVYPDGCTLHDARFKTPELPDLVVAYNLTNVIYPAMSEPWLLELIHKRKLLLLEEQRQQRFRQVLRRSLLVALAVMALVPFLYCARRKREGYGHIRTEHYKPEITP
jgi:hypothetical protein